METKRMLAVAKSHGFKAENLRDEYGAINVFIPYTQGGSDIVLNEVVRCETVKQLLFVLGY